MNAVQLIPGVTLLACPGSSATADAPLSYSFLSVSWAVRPTESADGTTVLLRLDTLIAQVRPFYLPIPARPGIIGTVHVS
jgi:hypothetical protein